MADQKVKVIIRVMPNGDEIDATLTVKATADQIIKKLMTDPKLKLQKNDTQGKPISYELLCKESGKNLSQNKLSLEQAAVKDGDTLLLTPSVIAGG